MDGTSRWATPQFPRWLHSATLGQIFHAKSQQEELQVCLPRHNWKPVTLFEPMPYPKTMVNALTRERKTVNSRAEEEHLHSSWIDERPLGQDASDFPKSFYRDDAVKDVNDKEITHLVVNSAEEEAEAKADGWVDGHTYWKAKADADADAEAQRAREAKWNKKNSK